MRKGFTLVELIFVIVIIGVLAAVAVPKFKQLKQNAEAASVVKVAQDTYASIPAAFVNIVDLEEDKNATSVILSDLVDVSGNGWVTTNTTATFTDSTAVATITLDGTNRNVRIQINCGGFKDNLSDQKCGKIITGVEASGETLDSNTSF